MTDKIKVLNLYSGLGGNRKGWDDKDVSVTAVEKNPEIAEIYKENFPEDEVVVGDAREYLLEHYDEFDFVWSSPPCQSHSQVRMMASKCDSYDPVFPDLDLYSEIIFLKHYFDGKWIVENVNPYYDNLIRYEAELGRHIIWSNFPIPRKDLDDGKKHTERGYISDSWFDLSDYDLSVRKDQILRNCVNPEIGEYIFDCAFKEKQKTLSEGFK